MSDEDWTSAEDLDLWGGCKFGLPTEEGGVGVVLFCSRKTNGLRFNWPLPGGRAVSVDCCQEHADEMTRMLGHLSYWES